MATPGSMLLPLQRAGHLRRDFTVIGIDFGDTQTLTWVLTGSVQWSHHCGRDGRPTADLPQRTHLKRGKVGAIPASRRILRTGVPWRDLPPDYGDWKNTHMPSERRLTWPSPSSGQ